MLNIAAFLLLTISSGAGKPPSQHFDLVEVNEFYSVESESLLFTQLIFRNYSPDHRRHEAEAWVLVNSSMEHPRKRGKHYVCTVMVQFQDEKGAAKTRKLVVTADKILYTKTTFDRERAEHRRFDPSYRTGFLKMR